MAGGLAEAERRQGEPGGTGVGGGTGRGGGQRGAGGAAGGGDEQQGPARCGLGEPPPHQLAGVVGLVEVVQDQDDGGGTADLGDQREEAADGTGRGAAALGGAADVLGGQVGFQTVEEGAQRGGAGLPGRSGEHPAAQPGGLLRDKAEQRALAGAGLSVDEQARAVSRGGVLEQFAHALELVLPSGADGFPVVLCHRKRSSPRRCRTGAAVRRRSSGVLCRRGAGSPHCAVDNVPVGAGVQRVVAVCGRVARKTPFRGRAQSSVPYALRTPRSERSA
ncbi:hypothetical protein SSCG_05810 [Streptomyces clavuligerus]|nr:hypothetical protein SSCG_05810 [Streptomyces clavuligerus]